eukprot:scaffold299166_cov38-Attheya_sp.AAC.1
MRAPRATKKVSVTVLNNIRVNERRKCIRYSSGISSEEEKSAFTEELSGNSGILIEAEQDKNDENVVSDLLEEEEKVASEDEDSPGFEESSEDTSSHS